MADFDYWKRQTREKPLFSNIDTQRPEQRRMAGKMLIIGGNRGVFFAAANTLAEAQRSGVGETRVLMPDSLRKVVPATPELYFAESETSGALGKAALPEMLKQAAWSDVVLAAGDLGKNAETTIVMSEFLSRCERPVWLMRDAIDVVAAEAANWCMRETDTVVFATMPQLQKIFRAVYYPRMITLSMPLAQLVETLHKFTISYNVVISTLHDGQLIVAQQGNVVTMPLADTDYAPLTLWNGGLLAKMSLLSYWNNTQDIFKNITAAWLM